MLVQTFRFLVVMAVVVAGPVCAQEPAPQHLDKLHGEEVRLVEELLVVADAVPATQPDKPVAPTAGNTQVLQELSVRLEQEIVRVDT